jgi:hypothetical protein
LAKAEAKSKLLLLGHEIAPPKRPLVLASKPGCIKVRLSFLTGSPKHVRNILLQEQCGTQPPYIEDICILMPRMKVFTLLETFLPAFAFLQKIGIIPFDANLQDFKILDEDAVTLAFLV